MKKEHSYRRIRPIDRYELSRGEGRTKISLSAQKVGDALVVCIFNENAHIGAIAMAEYDHKEKRASTSVITRLGHKDDVIAQRVAYLLSKHTQKTSCVVVGVHLDNITQEEIQRFLDNSDLLMTDLLKLLGSK